MLSSLGHLTAEVNSTSYSTSCRLNTRCRIYWAVPVMVASREKPPLEATKVLHRLHLKVLMHPFCLTSPCSYCPGIALVSVLQSCLAKVEISKPSFYMHCLFIHCFALVSQLSRYSAANSWNSNSLYIN